MGLDDRISWLLLGAALGFVFGYIVRGLREIKERLPKVDDEKRKNEEGLSHASWMGLSLLIVVLLTATAAFMSQKASNDVQSTQGQLSRVTRCNQQFLSKTIVALNQRTSFTIKQANSNVKLQKAQAEYLNKILQQPTPPRRELIVSLNTYFSSLKEFVDVSEQSRRQLSQNPYPTKKELSDCLRTGLPNR